MSDNIDIKTSAGKWSRRALAPEGQIVRPEGGPFPRRPAPFRHLPHLPSFRDNPIVFFTTCTDRRRKILDSPQCQKILREIWQRSADHDGWWVGHYILMPDHLHLFARPEIGARRMADWVQMWKSVSSRRVAAVLSIKPPIWQSEYFDRYLRSAESYSEKWHYVEQNAVRAGLAETAEAWPYRGAVHDLMF
jgi:REP element-mobilizing transposase RayT